MFQLLPSTIKFGFDVADLDQFLSQHRQLSITLPLSFWLLGVPGMYFWKTRGLKLPLIGAITGFIVTVASLELARSTVERQAWTEIDAVLNGRLVSVAVDDKPVASHATLMADLRSMRTHAPPGHHSKSLPHVYNVSLETTAGHLSLSLRRNDGDRREYWVDYTKYDTTSPISHLRTGALDAF